MGAQISLPLTLYGQIMELKAIFARVSMLAELETKFPHIFNRATRFGVFDLNSRDIKLDIFKTYLVETQSLCPDDMVVIKLAYPSDKVFVSSRTFDDNESYDVKT